jgi:[ribosomal protein S5]-alanine N-acetyltransferase
MATAILSTPRLLMRELSASDASFIVTLLNQPAFKQFIGDRGVRCDEDALRYIANQHKTQAQHGFALYAVEIKRDAIAPEGEASCAIGMCGLVSRATLPLPDIGIACLEEHWGKGYAREAAVEVLRWAHQGLNLARILAIVSPNNQRSIRLLEHIGMRFERAVVLGDGEEQVLQYQHTE